MKVHKFKKGILVNEDCLKALKKVKTESVDLVFADPPFNIGYKYDQYQDNKPKHTYLAWTRKWIQAVVRTLKPNGSIFVAIGDEYAAEIKIILDQAFGKDRMRNWIIWHYTFGVYCQKKFGRDHAHVLYYTRGRDFVFNGDSIRVPSARQTLYGDKRSDERGRVPSDVWLYPRVCGTFKERRGHPCQMPEALLDRVIKVASNTGDVVLDPFAGSGTTLEVAQKLNRRFIGMEISREYCRIIKARLQT